MFIELLSSFKYIVVFKVLKVSMIDSTHITLCVILSMSSFHNCLIFFVVINNQLNRYFN